MSCGEKLTIAQQIEHMKSQGIQFEKFSEQDALSYLENNNNYFKLRAYRKNYEKNGAGQYVGLDFAYLKDIAIIDMRIRYCFMEMCLDIEHVARIRLIKSVVDDPNEDGYSVVSDFEAENPEEYKLIIERASKSVYCADLQEKYKDKMPIWALVEMMQYSNLCRFYRFVAKRLNNMQMLNDYYMFQEIRQLRNACAHSNCVINDLKSSKPAKYSSDRTMMKELSKIGAISKDVRQRKLSNDRIRQMTTLLYLYKAYVLSSGLKVFHTRELKAVFFDRFNEHRDYYATSGPILSTFDFFQKIIDKWYLSEYNTSIVQKP